MKLLKKYWRRIKHDKGVVMVEYALLFAGIAVASFSLMPGGQIYDSLAGDLSFRLWLISLPIF